jgi:hypothetical protein
MPKFKKPSLSSRKELLAIVNSEDFLKLAINGHQCIETLLNEIISELLHDPHLIELSRLSFILKVDLSITLGQLSRSYRAALLKMNNIRNEFAHNKNAVLKKKKSQELFNSLPEDMRKYILKRNKNKPTEYDILQGATALMYVDLECTLENIRKIKLHNKIAKEMAEERMAEIWKGKEAELEEGVSRIQKEIEKRVKNIIDEGKNN